jgi:hypothetical protein
MRGDWRRWSATERWCAVTILITVVILLTMLLWAIPSNEWK